MFVQTNLTGYNFEYNNRLVCDGYELDIYIPQLNLAFEINGIFHYKPIFGEEKLAKIIKKDTIKKQRCEQAGIVLHILKDDSRRFSVAYGNIMLEIIYKKIQQHLYNKVLGEMANIKITNQIKSEI
jgi:hypothetical protein